MILIIRGIKKKKGTNELTYKTKIDAPKWKTDLWLSKWIGEQK